MSFAIVNAITVEETVVFDDGTYTYTVNSQITPTTIEVSSGELYMTSLPYCRASEKDSLTTSRICEGLEESQGSILESYGVVAGFAGVIFLITIILMLAGAIKIFYFQQELELNLETIFKAIIIIATSLIILGAASVAVGVF